MSFFYSWELVLGIKLGNYSWEFSVRKFLNISVEFQCEKMPEKWC